MEVMMRYHRPVHTVVVATVSLSITALLACKGAQSDAAETAGGASANGTIPICRLLTAEQVSTVLPNHDRGTQMASGPSLTKNVDSYQCSYTAVRGNDADLL